MNKRSSGLLPRYVAALQKHLEEAPGAGAAPALNLGRRARSLGVELLELARLHEKALVVLHLSRGRPVLLKRAEAFFGETVTAMMVTVGTTPRRREVEKAGLETVLSADGASAAGLLRESLDLQAGLRRLAHRNFATQEQERRTISHQLQDEIGQSLLAINVRLLILRTAAQGNTAKLAKEIIRTQRLVSASVRSVKRYARELFPDDP